MAASFPLWLLIPLASGERGHHVDACAPTSDCIGDGMVSGDHDSHGEAMSARCGFSDTTSYGCTQTNGPSVNGCGRLCWGQYLYEVPRKFGP